ncbi:MAG: SAM-dependent methyltransferase [Bacteroides sp.]|nr:SAM-dependent methyltransferase [Bacteroides sp.]MCM1379482.1 SAM-dependent methyltransferase [Bacteroides sp.]MCM1445915.1 SAM-dependent methyltransferase [Prevotella sp.]
MIEPALYLFPVGLSSVPPSYVLPQANIDLLRQVRHFVVENVRSARRFLKSVDKSINIDELTFTELSEHTPAESVPAMLQPLKQGEAVGVISEAGCPAVADPGADIVAAAQRLGFKVIPLVGPSSILLSLMGSGFNGQRFAFEGYLPIDGTVRDKRLREMQRRILTENQTQIFIETPYRNNKLLAELCAKLPGNLLLCVASDITGESQSIVTKPLSQWSKSRYDYNKIPTIFLLYHQ